MTKSAVMGAALEGEKLDLSTRQFITYTPVRSGKVVKYPFNLGIRADAVITESYEIPSECVEFVTSMVEVGDTIEGGKISGWAKKLPKAPTLRPGSGRHSESFVAIRGGCYALLQHPAKEILDNAAFQAANPPIIQVRRIAAEDDASENQQWDNE